MNYFWLPLLPGPHSFLIVRTAALCLAFESIRSSDLDARQSSSAVADLMKELPSGLFFFFSSGTVVPAITIPSNPSSANSLLLLGRLFLLPMALSLCLSRSLSEAFCVVCNLLTSGSVAAPPPPLLVCVTAFCFWDPFSGSLLSPVTLLIREKLARPSAPTSDFHEALWTQCAFWFRVGSSLTSDFKSPPCNPCTPLAFGVGWLSLPAGGAPSISLAFIFCS